MISYFDTSALIKKYIEEEGSEEVVRRWNNSDLMAVSSVAYAEFFSAINRKRREGTLSEEEYLSAIQDFKSDWETLVMIEVTIHLNQFIEDLTSSYPLRGFDAVHLASALYFQQFEEEQLCFICADRRLNDAAQQEGLNVVDLS
jgi:predicted nucleic acid-binding protein